MKAPGIGDAKLGERDFSRDSARELEATLFIFPSKSEDRAVVRIDCFETERFRNFGAIHLRTGRDLREINLFARYFISTCCRIQIQIWLDDFR